MKFVRLLPMITDDYIRQDPQSYKNSCDPRRRRYFTNSLRHCLRALSKGSLGVAENCRQEEDSTTAVAVSRRLLLESPVFSETPLFERLRVAALNGDG